MTKTASQTLGARWSVDFVTYGRARGYTRLAPIGLAGGGFTGPDSDDIGDMANFTDVTAELKNTAESEDLSKGFNQVLAAQKRTGTLWHWLFKKYRGRGPGQAYAICTADQAFTMSRLILGLREEVGAVVFAARLEWARGGEPVPGQAPRAEGSVPA